jgi:RNA polymerase sigma-70 factor (ECF subfamily)
MGSFFVRAALGRFELHSPEDLVKLLTRLARNKVTDAVRKQHAARRDQRREQHADLVLDGLVAQDQSPSQVVAGDELLRVFRERLSEEERYLAEQRAQGREWADIAADLGKGPEALRKRLERAVERVAGDLGLDEVVDE